MVVSRAHVRFAPFQKSLSLRVESGLRIVAEFARIWPLAAPARPNSGELGYIARVTGCAGNELAIEISAHPTLLPQVLT